LPPLLFSPVYVPFLFHSAGLLVLKHAVEKVYAIIYLHKEKPANGKMARKNVFNYNYCASIYQDSPLFRYCAMAAYIVVVYSFFLLPAVRENYSKYK